MQCLKMLAMLANSRIYKHVQTCTCKFNLTQQRGFITCAAVWNQLQRAILARSCNIRKSISNITQQSLGIITTVKTPEKPQSSILAKNTGPLAFNPCQIGNTFNRFESEYRSMDKLRIDKWLWAARFYKTRSMATDEVGKGRVAINDQTVKASREVKVGDLVKARQGDSIRTIRVLGLSDQRGSAPVAQALYEETPESITSRETISLQRRLAREPALSIEQGRPTKRNRRDLEKVKQGGWNDRWSASLQGD